MQFSGAVALAVYWLSMILRMCMFVRAIMSWFPGSRQSFLSRFLIAITEPIISPIRKLISKTPMGGGMIDLSFIITLILLMILTPPLVNWIASLPF